MQPNATRQRATRTVKIGDDHHRLLRILAEMLNITQQEAFEVSVEQTLHDYLEGRAITTKPLRDWANR